MVSLRMLRQQCITCGKAASVEVITTVGVIEGPFCRKHGMSRLADLEKSERALSLTIPRNPSWPEEGAPAPAEKPPLGVARAQAEVKPPVTAEELRDVNSAVEGAPLGSKEMAAIMEQGEAEDKVSHQRLPDVGKAREARRVGRGED